MSHARQLAVALAMLVLCGASEPAVKVVYAGSLVTSMERQVGPAFAQSCSCTYQGEGKGSVALTNMIEGGIRNPDIFISADTKLMERLKASPKHFISSYTVFAKARLVLGYSTKSPFADRFAAAAAGRLSIRQLLLTPGLRLGRTDPKLDPKGARSNFALAALNVSPARSMVFPEEDLLVRFEAGDLDAAFLYSTESVARNVPALQLPAAAIKGHEVTYSIAVLDAAPNPAGAHRFADFIMTGPGKELLKRAGLLYIKKTTR
ncbi:MAG: substrate-binding domain-containing protein [Candidatus Eremiobacteraeota bacterium]|nr:substrate-binding domain-containing protein [Candidatus Eremiobacteraeota bacterium]